MPDVEIDPASEDYEEDTAIDEPCGESWEHA